MKASIALSILGGQFPFQIGHNLDNHIIWGSMYLRHPQKITNKAVISNSGSSAVIRVSQIHANSNWR